MQQILRTSWRRGLIQTRLELKDSRARRLQIELTIGARRIVEFPAVRVAAPIEYWPMLTLLSLSNHLRGVGEASQLPGLARARSLGDDGK